jgi:hypothetical protein
MPTNVLQLGEPKHSTFFRQIDVSGRNFQQ